MRSRVREGKHRTSCIETDTKGNCMLALQYTLLCEQIFLNFRQDLKTGPNIRPISSTPIILMKHRVFSIVLSTRAASDTGARFSYGYYGLVQLAYVIAWQKSIEIFYNARQVGTVLIHFCRAVIKIFTITGCSESFKTFCIDTVANEVSKLSGQAY